MRGSTANPHRSTQARARRGRRPGALVAPLRGPLRLLPLFLLLAPSLHAQLVTGQVLERGVDDPVASATVQLLDAEGEAVSAIVTDGAGRYVLQAPGPGTYRVAASRAGFTGAASEQIRVEEGAVTTVPSLRLAVDEAAFEAAERSRAAQRPAFVGRVLEEGFRQPIEAAMVTLTRAAGPAGAAGAGIASAVTDADGRFRIEPPGPGRYRLHASRIGYAAAASEEVALTGGEAPEVVLELPYLGARRDPAAEETRRLEPGRAQFRRRSEAGFGFQFGRAAIADLEGVTQPSDVFYHVPGLSVHYDPDDLEHPGRARIISHQGWSCILVAFNHSTDLLSVWGANPLPEAGTAIGPTGTGSTVLDDMVAESEQWTIDSFALDEIQGIEIYRSYREVPQELKDGLLGSMLWPRDHLGGCGIAIIWTGASW